MKNTVFINGAKITKITKKHGVEGVITLDSVSTDLGRIQEIDAYNPEIVENLKDIVEQEFNFKRDSITIVSARAGQYGIGVNYDVKGIVQNVPQSVLDEITQKENETKLNLVEQKKIDSEIQEMNEKIKKLREEREQLNPVRLSF